METETMIEQFERIMHYTDAVKQASEDFECEIIMKKGKAYVRDIIEGSTYDVRAVQQLYNKWLQKG